MEDNALEFYSSGLNPINLGDIYKGEDFPIYPGELVVLQSEPKAMKTMLIHNWVLAFQRQTYFLEMEMSPRQMYMRHRMIKENISYEQVEADLKSGKKSGYTDEWLMIDYKSCFPFEIEKRLSAMSEKPEIIVIDHIGLMESNNRDMNGKMEEIMGALKEVAIRNNIIVFAISEMTKESMNKRMGVPAIAAARGSARIAYTANKLLSIVPTKNDEGLIDFIKLESVANREKEGINVMLEPNNCRINLVDDKSKFKKKSFKQYINKAVIAESKI
jgi:rRNA-processing protein FCF1